MKYKIVKKPDKLGQNFWHAIEKKTKQPLKDNKGLVVVSSNKELVIAYVMGVEGIGLV